MDHVPEINIVTYCRKIPINVLLQISLSLKQVLNKLQANEDAVFIRGWSLTWIHFGDPLVSPMNSLQLDAKNDFYEERLIRSGFLDSRIAFFISPGDFNHDSPLGVLSIASDQSNTKFEIIIRRIISGSYRKMHNDMIHWFPELLSEKQLPTIYPSIYL